MVRDMVTGECYRADHLLEAKLDELLKNPKSKEDEERYKEHRALAGTYRPLLERNNELHYSCGVFFID